MLFSEINAKLKPHRDKLSALELQAGVEKQADRAREGSIVPLGIDGEKVDPEEYFADEADYTRRGIRAAYFSVENIELRRELIKASRTLDTARHDVLDLEIGEKTADLTAAKSALRRLPWGTGAFIALACLALGQYSQGTLGAIGGGLLGFFLGLGYVWNEKGSRESALEHAEADLKNAQRDRRLRRLYPAMFNDHEQFSGDEQSEFSYASARAAVAKFLHEESA